jgi:hypothetical protein
MEAVIVLPEYLLTGHLFKCENRMRNIHLMQGLITKKIL